MYYAMLLPLDMHMQVHACTRMHAQTPTETKKLISNCKERERENERERESEREKEREEDNMQHPCLGCEILRTPTQTDMKCSPFDKMTKPFACRILQHQTLLIQTANGSMVLRILLLSQKSKLCLRMPRWNS